MIRSALTQTLFFPINTPLINYFFYKAPLTQNGPNVPLAGGFLFFFDDNNHDVMLPTYSDVSNPDEPVVNPNPLPLGAAGDCPLFYLNNQLYYIVITDSSGDIENPIATINHYNPADFQDEGSLVNNNFITNGQFSYPIEFWEDSQETGLITDPVTAVAWGWEFLQDPGTTTKNIVTFNEINNDNVPGDPILEIQLDSSNVGSEQTKEFRSRVGAVNFMIGQVVTFSFFMQSKTSGNVPVVLLLEKFYGLNGSDTEIITLNPFTVTPTRDQYVFSTTLPTNVGKIIGAGNYVAIRLQPGLGQACTFAATNALMLPGNLTATPPSYAEESFGDTVSQILGVSTQIDNAGLNQNFTPYYYNNGTILPIQRTGEIILMTKNTNPAFTNLCDGSSRNVSDYDTATKIPNRRLYDVIGRQYGGTGELVVTSSNNVVTFESGVGAIAKTAYGAGTTSFTIANPEPGLFMGIDLVRTSPTTVQATWLTNFAPDQIASSPGIQPYTRTDGLMSYWTVNDSGILASQITITTVNPGSGIAQAVADIEFNNEAIIDYQTTASKGATVPITNSFLEFAAFSTNNTRGTYPSFSGLILFAVDNQLVNPTPVQGNPEAIVQFFSANSLSKNLDVFVSTIANPFQWTVTVTVAPSASQYFLYSSNTTDFYGWFKVDGIGTDPMVAGRTGVEIDISSLDTTTQIAAKIALAVDDFTFNLPDQATDLPTIPMDSPASYYIYI